MSMKNIGEEIKTSNNALGKEIRDGRIEMKEEMKDLKLKLESEVEKVKDDSKRLEEEVRRGNKENKERMMRMETRLEKVEGENKKLDEREKNRDEIRKKGEEEIVTVIKPGGRKMNYSEKVKNGSDNEKVEEPVYKSTWAKEMSQISLENQLKLATEAAAKLEGQEKEEGTWESEFKKKERGRKVKKLKLGDSVELHDNNDWPWEESEQDWDGMVDRAERNKVKKEKEKERKRKRVEKAVRIGQCTIGIGPIKEESYDYFYNITADFDEAKRMAAAEFLTEYLRFDHRDMADINITDTKVSGKRDDILYLVLDSPTKIRDIRKEDCRLPKLDDKNEGLHSPDIFLSIHNTKSTRCRSQVRKQ